MSCLSVEGNIYNLTFSIVGALHQSLNGRKSIIKNNKRAFIQRKIHIKGAPRTVVVTVNGQRVDTNTGGAILPVQPPKPVVMPVRNSPINLHINLQRKQYDTNFIPQRKRPIIIANPNPPQPMRTIVIPIPMAPQAQLPQQLVLPAPLPPPPALLPAPVQPLPAPLPAPAPVAIPVPVPVPVPAPAPPLSDKDDTDLASILQTAALLNSLGKKEESRPVMPPIMPPFFPPMAYQPPFMG